MNSQKIIKIAVISDPHAFDGASGDSSPSWIAMKDDQSNPIGNPFAGIKKLILDEQLKAEILICGGDLGDKSVPQAQQYAWKEINEIGGLLNAQEVLGAAGNHDVDSRFAHTDHDAKGQLLSLLPPFPIKNSHNWMEYWAKNYTVFSICGIRFVLLNSSAFHGYQRPRSSPGQDDFPPEYLNGRVSNRTLDAFKSQVIEDGERPVNVLLCHHHPAKNDVVGLVDYSHMTNGDRLLNILDDMNVGPWLVVHGHKHIPRIFYAPGGSSSPTIFSAGSFAAKQYPEIQSIARCEFYILEMVVPSTMSSGTVKGKLCVWQWSYGVGWIRGRNGDGLGYRAAFGTRLDVDEFAEQVAGRLKADFRGRQVNWSEIAVLEPKVEYLTPQDAKRFFDRLSSRHAVECLRDNVGEISQLQVPN